MPIFEYRCKVCGHITEELRKYEDRDIPFVCECGASAERIGLGYDSNKTIKDNGSIITSGVTPPDGGTQRGAQPVISAGISQPAQVISAGIAGAPGSEIVLNDSQYKLLKTISRSTGEAEVYLVKKKNQKYIFKYYYPNFKPKDSILKKLKGLHHEDTVDLVDYGYYGDRFFEIMEYAEGGSLVDKNEDGTYKYIPIKNINKIKQIVKETINAFNFCHSKEIIHRDIKPENMFFKNSDGTDIIIGDFGISSELEKGKSRRLTSQSLTVGYAPPELYGVGGEVYIGKEIDYYAMGLSIIHLWLGESPFEDLGVPAIANLTISGKIDIPDDMPDDIKTLIKGLITTDYSKRWGYEEVQKWLAGEYVPVHYKVVETKYGDFHFGFIDGEKIVINDPVELAKLLEKHRTQGKKHLYKGTIQKWVENVDQSLYVEIMGIVEDEYPADEDAGLIKAIYTLDPGKNYKTFTGVECITAEEIGDALEKEDSYYKSTLTKNLNADFYIFLEARGSKKEADTFRKYTKTYNPEKALNTIILELQGKDKFKIDNIVFFKPEDLLLADTKIKIKTVKLLIKPDSKLSIWLEQFFILKNNIDKWRKLGRYYVSSTLSYALEERSPFHFYTDLAYDLEDFGNLFAKYILNKEHSDKLTIPKSRFVEEAEFWLKEYQNTNYLEIIREYLEKNISKIDKRICSKLIDYIRQTIPDKDYYWNDIKPIVDEGYENKVISEETFKEHKDFLFNTLSVSNISRVKIYLQESINKKDIETFESIVKWLIQSNIKIDDYFEKIKPLVDSGHSKGVVSDATLKKQQEFLKPRKSELQTTFNDKKGKIRTDLQKIESYDFRILSSELNTIKDLIKKTGKEISHAESQWSENSFKKIQEAIHSLNKAESNLDKLKQLRTTAELLKEKEKIRKKTIRKESLLTIILVLTCVSIPGITIGISSISTIAHPVGFMIALSILLIIQIRMWWRTSSYDKDPLVPGNNYIFPFIWFFILWAFSKDAGVGFLGALFGIGESFLMRLTEQIQRKKGTKYEVWYYIIILIVLACLIFPRISESRTSINEVEKTTMIKQEMTGTVRVTANFRSGPSTKYSAIGVIKEGEKVIIMSKEGNWYRIKYNGNVGYIHEKLINR